MIGDPNEPVYDPVHGLYHLFYQDGPMYESWPNGSLTQGPVQGHVVSRDLLHWAHLPVALWNDQPYDSVAVYTGSAAVHNGSVVLVYPGVCDGHTPSHTPINATWPSCGDDFQHHYNLVAATPSDPTDPLLRTWRKRVVANRTERDPSGAWRTPYGEWRLLTWDGWEYGTMDFETFYKAGQVSGLPTGDCPSLFPLPPPTPGSGPAPAGASRPTHVFKYSWIAAERSADYALIGTYIDPPPKPRGAGGLWESTPGVPVTEQLLDGGGAMYASKDFYDPVRKRRIMWGHINAPPSSALTLPREVTWHAELQQLNLAPIAELTKLRVAPLPGVNVPTALPILVHRPTTDAPLRIGPWPAGAARQCEVEAVFALPSAPVNLSLALRTSSRPDATGTRFVLQYTPPAAKGIRYAAVVAVEPVAPTGRSFSAQAAKSRQWQSMAISPRDSSLTLRLFVDHTLSEAYWQGGRAVMSVPVATTSEAVIELGATAAATLRTLHAWRIGAIWVGTDEVLP